MVPELALASAIDLLEALDLKRVGEPQYGKRDPHLQFLKRYVIYGPDGLPFMDRYVLVPKKRFLHVILRSDADPWPHDHPWDWTSRIVHGSYIQVVDGLEGRFEEGDLNSLPADVPHKLILDRGPVVTLFEHGETKREWGFQSPGGWVHHLHYFQGQGRRPADV